MFSNVYVYIKSETGLWTVGFYDPNGNWQPESDWPTTEEAATQVADLNGNRHETEWLRGALFKISNIHTDWTTTADSNMERVRAIARRALSGFVVADSNAKERRSGCSSNER